MRFKESFRIETFEEDQTRDDAGDSVNRIKAGSGYLIAGVPTLPDSKEKLESNYNDWTDNMRHLRMGLKTEKGRLSK